MKNIWELYSSDPLWEEATIELNNTWNAGVEKNLTPDAIEISMYKVMDKYAEQGARDSEPRDYLGWLIENYRKYQKLQASLYLP